jgi:LacI family transcriptional regulator
MAVTMHDVARQAGVSIATVSHVLSSTGRITPRTRRRVLAAVKKLRYYPNVHARNLAAQNSRTLGMIVSDIANPFFPDVINGFERRARQFRYETIVSNTNYAPSLMRRAVQRMLEQNVRGVAIVTSEFSRVLIEDIIARRIAVAFLDLGPVGEYVSNIKIDYFSGIRQAVEHLYQLGHRRIAFAGGRSKFTNIMARQRAYVECMQTLGLEPGPILPGNQRFDGGFAAGLAILQASPRPTAVIAINDLTAAGVVKALHRSGLRIPADVSVVGFDRTRLAEYLTPSLTTVDIHPELLGKTAAEALHELSSSSRPQGREYSIPAELVPGESTGRVPESASIA